MPTELTKECSPDTRLHCFTGLCPKIGESDAVRSIPMFHSVMQIAS